MERIRDRDHYVLVFVGNRGVGSDDSKIIFTIPVHVMNLNHIFTDVKRDIALAMYIGDSKMWAGYKEVTIKNITTAVASPTLETLSVKSVNLLNSGSIAIGDGVVYRVVVTAQQGWSNFDVELTGVSGKRN